MLFNCITLSGEIKSFDFNGLVLNYFLKLNNIYQLFVYYNSLYRYSSSSQKCRSFVNYSTRKIYKQKGTGKARTGSSSSPLKIKGARAFPNLYYQNYKLHYNKNTYKLSYFILYSVLVLNNFLYIIEDIFFIEKKTKLLLFYFKFFIKSNNYLFLTIKINKNFFLSLSNFNKLKIIYFYNFNPILLLKNKFLIVSKSCFEEFLND